LTGEIQPSGGRLDQTTDRPASHNLGLCLTVAGVDLDAVRTFVAAADAGRLQEAAADLSISRQAVSKRVAAPRDRLGPARPGRAGTWTPAWARPAATAS
jgi:hypothetical protein